MTVAPHECLHKKENCSGHEKFNLAAQGAAVGPLSALGDGYVVGLTRAGPASSVFLLKLKDEDDIGSGVDVTRIAKLDGDPYMYTDFTGATLYLTEAEKIFEFDDLSNKKKNKAIGFTWQKKEGGSSDWDDIEMKVRCFKDDDGPGKWESVGKVKDAKKMTFIKTKSCADKEYDRVEVRLEQDNDEDTLSFVKKIQVTVYQ